MHIINQSIQQKGEMIWPEASPDPFCSDVSCNVNVNGHSITNIMQLRSFTSYMQHTLSIIPSHQSNGCGLLFAL
jgi:hypothetical protein